jgi:hypothetical protein
MFADGGNENAMELEFELELVELPESGKLGDTAE